MTEKKNGRRTVRFPHEPSVLAGACVVGKKEGEGPLRKWFDEIGEDSYFGQKSWEKAESVMLQRALALCCDKAGCSQSSIDFAFTGDLLNQCTGSAFALRDSGVSLLGLYGACSTMAEAMTLAAMSVDGGFAETAAALTSSHFCSAERQFRLPLEYGGQRPQSSQWTVTGAGAVLIGKTGPGPYITDATIGCITDAGVKDANNMGAAMAPAAYDTLKTHFEDTGREPSYYSAIITGDLGKVGHEILTELFRDDGVDLGVCSLDCGMLIYDMAAQDVHAGGSGCGCSASVFSGHILQRMTRGEWPRVLFAATGALLSPTTIQQGESIPGICHAVSLSMERSGQGC